MFFLRLSDNSRSNNTILVFGRLLDYLYCRLVVVTAFSNNPFDEAQDSVQRQMQPSVRVTSSFFGSMETYVLHTSSKAIPEMS